ncbi:hypothetical protein ABPG74_019331, partial [Tetrahymena malaccensis]
MKENIIYFLILFFSQLAQINLQQILEQCSFQNTFFQSKDDTCMRCPYNCSLCNQIDQCISCQDGFYINSLGQCLSNCAQDQVQDSLSMKCDYPFDKNCKKFDFFGKCVLCDEGYILNVQNLCINILCSQYNGQYDANTKMCSLSYYLLSQNVRENQNLHSVDTIQTKVDFQYSSYRQKMNQQILNIQMLNVANRNIILATTNQYFLFYNLSNMECLNMIDMSGPIIYTKLDSQDQRLMCLISQMQVSQSNQNQYILSSIWSIDQITYQKQLIYQNNQIADFILLNSQYSVFINNNNLMIVEFANQQTNEQQFDQQIMIAVLMENDFVLLLQDTNQNIYLINLLSKQKNQFKQSNKLSYFKIQSIISWSFISFFQVDQNNQPYQIQIYNIKQQIDSQNVVGYTIGDLNQQIDFSGQTIQVTNQQDLIYLVSSKEIQAWKSSKIAYSINIENSNYQLINDQFIIVSYNQQIKVYKSLIPFINQYQEYSLPYEIQANLLFYDNNSILFSTGNDIQKISKNQLQGQDYQFQAFISSDTQLNLQKQIVKYMVYSSDNIQNIYTQSGPLIIISISDNQYQLQVSTITSTSQDNCNLQTQMTQYLNVQIDFGIIVQNDLTGFIVFSFNCNPIIPYQNYMHDWLQIIDSNTLILRAQTAFSIFNIKSKTKSSIISLTNLRFSYFRSINVLVIQPQLQPGTPSTQLFLYKIYLNSQNYNMNQIYRLQETQFSQNVSTFIIYINGQNLYYMDMSSQSIQYTSTSFQDNIGSIEEITGSNKYLLIRFQNDKFNAVLLDTQKNYSNYINNQIGNIIYFQSNILFLTYPKNEVLSYILNYTLNQNLFFSYLDAQKFNQYPLIKVLAISQNNQLQIVSIKDGNIRQFISNQQEETYFENIENTDIYIFSQFTQGALNPLIIKDFQTQKNISLNYISSHQVLQNKDQIFIIAYDQLHGNQIIVDRNLVSQTSLANALQGYNVTSLQYFQNSYYFMSTSQNQLSIFNINGQIVIQQNLIIQNIIIYNEIMIIFQQNQISKYNVDIQNKQLIQLNMLQFNSIYNNASLNKILGVLCIQLIDSLLVLQVDTFKLIQSVSFNSNYIYVGSDQINQMEMFKYQNQVILFSLNNYQLTIFQASADLTNLTIYIDCQLGIFIIVNNQQTTATINNFIGYIIIYTGQMTIQQFQIQNYNIHAPTGNYLYNQHLSTLLFEQYGQVYMLDVNYYFYQRKYFELLTYNWYAVLGQGQNQIAILNNNINYISIFDSYQQTFQQGIILNNQINTDTIYNYQMVQFLNDNLIVCIGYFDYFIIDYSSYKIISQTNLNNVDGYNISVQNIIISNQFSTLLYQDTTQNIYLFSPSSQQFIGLSFISNQVTQIVIINMRLIAFEQLVNNLSSVIVYDQKGKQTLKLQIPDGNIVDIKQQDYLVISSLVNLINTKITIFKFNETDNSFILYQYQFNGLYQIINIFNEQLFNNTQSIYLLTQQQNQNVIVQFWKIKEIKSKDQTQNSSAIFIQQFAKPCSNNTNIKVENKFFYFICPFIAQIFNQNITFISNIKYLISSNQIITDISYLDHNIFQVTISSIQLDYYEIAQNFINKIKSLTNLKYPQLYKYEANFISNTIMLSIYGISSYNLFQVQIVYQSKLFNQNLANNLDYNEVQVYIKDTSDNYKHEIQQLQIPINNKSLRYEIYYYPSQIIYKFPVVITFENSDIIEIYTDNSAPNYSQNNQLVINSSDFISSSFKNLKIGSLQLLFNLTDQQ